ncbi:MAG: MarR family transcriptional regulator [Flavobacteriaceae bacterium]|nr:MarR family transcriptional regulator [Flavobacteriaceae bacterium]|tara:strand:+ start:266 stop:700 length:435 start_codon:yes stop_codon:yes gene_type:complete
MSEKFVEHQIRYTWRSIYKMHNEQAVKAGGTLSQAVVLLNLNPNKGTPSTSLGPKMGLESTSLGRTLKSMENNGLITRVPNYEDKRGVFILLTKKGNALRSISKKNGNKFNKFVLNKIGEKKLSIFFDVLKSINATIKDGQIFK